VLLTSPHGARRMTGRQAGKKIPLSGGKELYLNMDGK